VTRRLKSRRLNSRRLTSSSSIRVIQMSHYVRDIQRFHWVRDKTTQIKTTHIFIIYSRSSDVSLRSWYSDIYIFLGKKWQHTEKSNLKRFEHIDLVSFAKETYKRDYFLWSNKWQHTEKSNLKRFEQIDLAAQLLHYRVAKTHRIP